MIKTHVLRFLLVIIGSFFILGNLGASSWEEEYKKDSKKLENLYMSVEALLEFNQSCNTPADCVPVALGKKACGGPKKYKFLSTFHPYADVIEFLTLELQDFENQYNIKYGIISTCDWVISSPAVCVENRCEVKTGH